MCPFWHLDFQKWPETVSFNTFDLRTCFAPQRRALFDLSYIMDLWKDPYKCPFAEFLPLGRISCEGTGHGHFLTCIWHLFSCPYFTLHKHMSFFSLAEIPGKRTDITRKERKYPGRVNMTKNVNMRWHCFCLLFLFLRNGLLKKLSNRISPLGRVVENVSNRLTRWRSCRNAARRLKRLEDQRTGRLGRGHGGPSGFSQNT